MSKFRMLVVVLSSFVLGFLSCWLYSSKAPEPAAATPAVMKTYYRNSAADMQGYVAQHCSVKPNTCEVLFNNKTTSTIQLVGDVNKTWVMLGDKKVESSTFYGEMYLGNYPEGVAGISFR